MSNESQTNVNLNLNLMLTLLWAFSAINIFLTHHDLFGSGVASRWSESLTVAVQCSTHQSWLIVLNLIVWTQEIINQFLVKDVSKSWKGGILWQNIIITIRLMFVDFPKFVSMIFDYNLSFGSPLAVYKSWCVRPPFFDPIVLCFP